MAVDEARQRLRNLADDCEARARRSSNDEARSRYHRLALDARRDAAARYMGEEGLRMALDAAASQMRFAAWLDGETIDAAQERGEVRSNGERSFSDSEKVGFAEIGLSPRDIHEARDGEGVTAREDAPRPRQGLNARQLARLAGMSERGALKRIVHGFHRALPGFYRDGGRWFADRDAFDQFRMSSD